ncbi:GntP family permease [Candidatus Uabimicrobium amorphum]|uniref:Citrate transporter n=1 Tax=Uabimicrobium amorphum TaxID=2596890 RepID=A0A5S9F7C1_UABAM|nr:GntP family permease [Candidatus Uabimicrobium amorphum]BBM87484.1 citrate transporter [Candidatus Uabimicrobium amorphum]
MEYLGYVGLFVSLVMLVVLSYKQVSPLIVGPITSLFLIVVCGLNPTEMMFGSDTPDTYMKVAADFFAKFFLIFLTGSIYGVIMHKTGAAAAIAEKIVDIVGEKRVVLGIVLASSILTYGGVSLFVIIFVMYPISLAMFHKANITKTLIPACVALGSFTFTMTAPGSPQIQNIIPTEFLKTPVTSAFYPGWIAGLFMAVVGFFYLSWRAKKLQEQGRVFDAHDELEDQSQNLPSFWLSMTPSLCIIVLLNGFGINIVWSMCAGILLTIALLWNCLPNRHEWLKSLNTGASNSTLVILNTAAIVGYAGVVKAIPEFNSIVEAIKGLDVSPYYFPAITTTAIAGIAGSASGGLSVALKALAETFVSMGIDLEAVHRIAAMASGCLDSLPHSGAVITLLLVCKLDHKSSYKDVFVTTVLIPTVAVFLVLVPICAFVYS